MGRPNRSMGPGQGMGLPTPNMGPRPNMGPPGLDILNRFLIELGLAMRPPGPDMRTYRHHMRPQQGMGPPGPYLGPPGPGMGPPGPGMRPFRYHTELWPYVGHPGPGFGPPGPDMRPYSYHMGPRPDMGPPERDKRTYRHRMRPRQGMGRHEPGVGPTLQTQVTESKKQPEAVEEKEPEPKAELKAEPKAEPKPVNKSRPVARIAIPGTVWSLVRTSDGRCFFYDPSKRHSVWERPEELKDRPDVDELLSHKPEVTTEDKEEKDVQEEPPSKRMKSETEVKEVKKVNKNELAQQTVLGQETAIKVEAQEAQQRSVVSMEVRMKLFKELLAEKNISAHARWEKELHKIAYDKRYLLLTSRERRQVFEEYVKDRAEKEDNENNQKINEKKELCRQLLEESNLNEKIDKMWDSKSMFTDSIREFTEQKQLQNPLIKKLNDFMQMLREIPGINSSSSWSDVRSQVSSDPRYEAAVTDSRREYWFREYLKTVNNATSDDIGTKGELEKKPHSSSLKEKSESRQNHREEVIADFKQYLAEKATSDDIGTKGEQGHSFLLKEKSEIRQITRQDFEKFKQFLAEKVTHSEDSFVCFKSLFYKNPIWRLALSVIDMEKLYNSQVDEVRKKNRAILWSILDGIDVSLGRAWYTVKEEVQADPRFLNYTASKWKCVMEYAAYMSKKSLKAKEDFQELLKETNHITPETKTKLQQGIVTLDEIEYLIKSDKRYTALTYISNEREQMLQAYIDELSERNQPSHSLSSAAAPVTG